MDSVQLFDYLEKNDDVVDVGSGAGLPGLVLAIVGVEKMTLVESDTRKTVFLREAARVTETPVAIVNQRIENTDVSGFTTVTSRAFSSVAETLDKLKNTLKVNHKLMLLKGKNHQLELQEARKHWAFDTEVHKSVTDKEGVILILKNPHRQGTTQ